MTDYNPQPVQDFLSSLGHVQSGGCTEIRILLKDRYLRIKGKREYVGNTVAGSYTDYEKAARDIEPFDGKANIYATINPCGIKLMRRAQNRLKPNVKTTASDKDIHSIRWFVFDTDPVRPADTPSSKNELRAALERRDQVIREVFEPLGIPVISAMSGNGGHGLIPLVGYSNTEETQAKIKRLLDWLSDTFSDDVVTVDRTVGNPARIWKVYGTLACKGDNTPEAPYRRASIELPTEPIDPFDLLAIIDDIIPKNWNPTENNPRSSTRQTASHNRDYPLLDVEKYLDHYDYAFKVKTKGERTIYELDQCPFNPDHNRGEVCITQDADGKLGFKCFHNSCDDKTWQDAKGAIGNPQPFYQKNGSSPNGNTRVAYPDSSDVPHSVRGVFEGRGYYYRYEKQNDDLVEKPISSFCMKPKLRVWLDGKENLTVDLVTSEKTYPDVVIRRRDWNSNERFMDAFPSVDLTWYGGRNDVQAVQEIVASYPVPVKQGTTQLGRHPTGLWILPDGAINRDGFIKEPDLIYLPNGGRGELDNKISIPNPSDEEYQKLLVEIYTNLPALNEVTVTIPTIGWFLATPFKPQFSDRYEGFPHLSIWGTRGAGKSTLLRLMWRLAGFKRGLGNKLFSCTETDFVMLRLLSATTSIPVVLDEYKPYDMPPQRHKALTRLLRKAYDGETEFRGRPDQTTVEYSLSAPIAIAGEVALSEGAHLERIVSVEMSPNKLTPVMRKAHKSLQKLPLQAFNSRYIPFCLRTDFDAELEKVEARTRALIDLDELPDRVQKNLTVMVFGFQQYIRFGIEQGILDENDDVTEDLSKAVLAVKNAVCGENGVTKVALDYMIEHLAIMAETGRLEYNRDYTVRETYGDIAIRFDSCFAEFRKYHRETQLSGELLDEKAYRRQIRENLEQKSYITGTNVNVKFGRNTKKGVLIDPHCATLLGMDLDGFYGNEPDEG